MTTVLSQIYEVGLQHDAVLSGIHEVRLQHDAVLSGIHEVGLQHDAVLSGIHEVGLQPDRHHPARAPVPAQATPTGATPPTPADAAKPA